MVRTFDSTEFHSLARELEKHHGIFERLWSMARPTFTESIPTAAVSFDRVGECINFSVNPTFWDSLSDVEKQFVISHECLHVVLYHGLRINALRGTEAQIANKALDIVVNHSLVSKFGFNRQDVDPTNKYCWIDTVFKTNPPPVDKYFEFYYNLIKEQQEQPSGGGLASEGGEVLDSHDGLESFNTKEFEDKLKEISSEDDLSSLSEFVEKQTEDLQSLAQQAGVNPGNTFVIAKVGKVKSKKKWETIIKKWASKYMKDNEVEQWARLNRRLVFMSNDFILPSDQEVEEFEKDRIQVWFFQDTSGSCSGFIDRFFKAAKSLPPERFDVKMHCFDTRVFETTLESGKLYGFGGTSFSCIERYIQQYIATHKVAYPKAVFIITDGMGDMVNPQVPENWYWFLSYRYVSCIPKTSKIFNLADYE